MPDTTPLPTALSGRQKMLRLVAALVVAGAAYQTFNLGRWVGYVPLSNQFMYGVLALLLPFSFLLWPRWRPLDALLSIAALIACAYFTAVSENIVMQGWEYAAPPVAQWMSVLLWVLVLEAGRRIGGNVMFAVVAPLSLYPLFADRLPPVLAGFSLPSLDAASFYAMSNEGILGVPMRAFINLVLGFLIFGVALQRTGGGKFFLDLAFGALGHVRGGPAKVAVLSSGLMGSMSGSVITNVLTTGTLTIPTMKRTGIPPAVAGGVEACASTGGVLAPPIMGATAFVMATFLKVPYQDIAIAAVIPTLLYFLGLFFQVDAMAARNGLAGLPRKELPQIRQVLKDGWWYLAVFALLTWMLLVLNREAWAPWFATAILLLINQMLPSHRWGLNELFGFLEDVGRLFAEMAGLLAAVGLIVGSLVVTGKIGNIASDLLTMAGGNLYLLLAMGALTAFVLGIGMTVTAAYIFLAVGLAPALVQAGLEPLPVHLFILYWSMLSYITPPVAIGAFAAATIAKASPMRTGLEAMRLGGVIYLLPFFFVVAPALLMKGTAFDIVLNSGSALLGVFLISCAAQNWFIGLGAYPSRLPGVILRLLTFGSGLALALPGGALTGVSAGNLLVAAALLIAPVLITFFFIGRISIERPSL
ncbi:TRAP transporter permease [Mesorhizobium xinjiangense]|uniref:TRAP transporter permease n=1 Tax=Mesorhizobium xinjiangense TaxID=2678685 RepID=UPI0012EE4CB5|nr:TRAP transporter fused permease subunit [Mesorhizobium xinjiangense]